MLLPAMLQVSQVNVAFDFCSLMQIRWQDAFEAPSEMRRQRADIFAHRDVLFD